MARHPGRLVALVAGAGLLGLLGACDVPVSEPPASVPPEQPPAAVPTQGTGAQEEPLPEAPAQPVLTTAVAGTGAGNLVAPDTVCVFWTWGGDGLPQLTDGLWFTVDHPAVVPQTWTASHDACGDSGNGVQWCDGAKITVDDSTCVIGFVRAGTPSAQALVGMVGTLTCTAPLSAPDCASLTQTIDDSADVSPDLDLEAVAAGGG
ncbi:hypothetical protein [Cellulomonas sp. URHD0024]|uniref:hypothetical protein n=1 Tax=Cellulomonas sp. URHD0024 TaxID=1302620 RepID=UPI000401A95D|nr:hypothetical protein [Cellulomonas sp. URHD0024]